jgi:hypothetical protein
VGEDVEEWRVVPGWPYYEVSDHGRVRSIDRVIVDRRGRQCRKRGKILALQIREDGHLNVGLSSPGRSRRMAKVHALVLEAFVGPCPRGMECLHRNDVGTDNRLSNLSWGTHTENMQDVVRNGLHTNANKTHCPRSHLLEHPNLVVSLLKLNRRQCRSCAAARALAGGKRPSIRRVDIQAVADKYYFERWRPAEEAA